MAFRLRAVHGRPRRVRRAAIFGGALLLGVLVAACNDLTGAMPSGTPDPSSFDTPAGAVGRRNDAIATFSSALPAYVRDGGLLTDELEDSHTGGSPSVTTTGVPDPLDERLLPEGGLGDLSGTSDYPDLQRARGAMQLAIQALAAYDTGASPALRGELYALRGYSEVLLAELFCSGVPLSTIQLGGDYTYHASSTAAEVYVAAIADFDSAAALAAGVDTVLDLARVGKGRALLDLDSASAAGQAVDSVPDDFQYRLAVQWRSVVGGANVLNNYATVSDSEGGVGVPFLSSADPRIAPIKTGTNSSTGTPLFFPARYAPALQGTNYAPFPLANGIEARLIRAEAALRQHDFSTWMAILNQLRATATVPGQNATLSPLSDPGSDSARVRLMFDERAYWLFLSGHREGDLRRLLRQYGYSADVVYPTGQYLAPGEGLYGNDINVPIPTSENPNPLFHGCLDRDP